MNREVGGGKGSRNNSCQQKYMIVNVLIGSVRVSISKYTYAESCKSSIIK